MWWLGLRPNHHIYSSLLRARRFFITQLGLFGGVGFENPAWGILTGRGGRHGGLGDADRIG